MNYELFAGGATLLFPFMVHLKTLAGLARMYPWAFSVADHQAGYVRPEPREVEEPFDFNGLKITPIEVQHGRVRTHGFRFDHPTIGSLAYLPDVKTIPKQSLKLLRGPRLFRSRRASIQKPITPT